MPCDPKKIFTDLNVIGVTLTYANIWVAGTKKVNATTTTADVEVFSFEYKSEDFYNVFRYNATTSVLESAEVRRGTFTSGNEDAGTLIEKIEY